MEKPVTTYVICATPRCGSHLLAEAFHISGVAGNPDEYFITNGKGQLQNEQGHISELYGKRSLESFHELILSIGSTDNGVFGIMLHWTYLHFVFRQFRTLPQYADLNDREILDSLFFNPKYIWIQRRDKLRQAISNIKASQTGVWKQPKGGQAKAKPKAELAFDYFRIEQGMQRFEEMEQAWAAFFAAHGIEPYVVVYEDLANAFEETSRALHAFLGVDYPDDVDFSQMRIKKQANSLNEQWAQKYLLLKRSFAHRIFRVLRYWRFKLLPH